MFGHFKRTKIENWETELLIRVLMQLPKEYLILINQIKDGLFRGVLTDVSDIPGYVAFTFNSDQLKKYDKASLKDYKLTNIKVYDKKSSNFLSYEIYVSSGTISGYSLENKKHDIDLTQIDVSGFKKEIIGGSDYERIVNTLSKEEESLINPSDIYSVIIENKEYFHIKDLEDGNFIGIDDKKNVYKFTHNPLEITALNKTITDVLDESH